MTTSTERNSTVLFLFVLLGSIIMIYPLIWLFSSSFKLPQNIFTDKGVWSEAFTLDNYFRGWQGVANIPFSTFFGNSFLVSGLSIFGNIISCSMAAFAFARLEFRLKKILFACLLLTMMLPYHVVIIPQYIIFNKLNWVNTFLPFTVPKFLAVDGFFVFLMVQFFRGLPRELDNAATVDGCGSFQIYWRIMLPLAVPAVVTTAIFTFIWTWNDFFSQLLYLSDPKKYTVSLGLRSFLDSTNESNWGPLFAMSILTLIPIFAIFIFFQRYLIEGIVSGSVKG